MIVRVKRKIKKLKTEKEINDRLAKVLKDFEWLKDELDNTPLDDKHMVDLCDDMTYVEAEIKTLRWVLGE
jgi:hypothetical protein